MMTTDTGILLQGASACALALCGLALLFFGFRLPRFGDWTVGIVIAFSLGMTIANWVDFSGAGYQPVSVIRGWIWSRTAPGAISAGVLRDGAGLTIDFLVFLVAAILLLARERFIQEGRPERLYAALAFAACGASVSWIAATPWMGFVGLVIAALGGLLSYSSRWESDPESAIVSHYGWSRGWALGLAILGAILMATDQAPLSWSSEVQLTPIAALGGFLAAAGLLMSLDSFPLLDFLTLSPESSTPIEIVSARIFPSAAAFALIFRFEPQMRGLQVFPVFGWIALAVSFLAILHGFFQPSWKNALYSWVSAGFAFALAALCQAGPRIGFTIFVSALLGSTLLAISGGELEQSATNSNSHRNRAIWIKVAAFAGAALATSLPGFLAGHELVSWFAGVLGGDNPTLAILPASLLLLSSLLAWRVFWLERNLRAYCVASWRTIGATVMLGLIGLAVFWTGSLSGGLVEGVPDRVMPPLLDALFVVSPNAPSEMVLATALPLYIGVAVFAFLLSAWLGAKEDRWQALSKSFPGFGRFVNSGYGAGPIGRASCRGLVATARALGAWLDERFWSKWLPTGMGEAIRWPAALVSDIDRKGGARVLVLLRPTTDATAKFLQLIQNGDVQWYLIFALGSGLAILLHFLRVT